MRITAEMVRELQKTGEYEFRGMNQADSRKAATKLAAAGKAYDVKNGITNTEYGIARDAFGYYSAYVEATY